VPAVETSLTDQVAMTKLGSEALYRQLGHHIATVPNLAQMDHPEVMLWLGRAFALVAATGDGAAARRVKRLHKLLRTRISPDPLKRNHELISLNVMELMDILYRALAVAELNAPSAVQGAFIPAGSPFDAMAAMGKVLGTAKTDVLIVDPYMDEKALTDFAGLTLAGVSTRLLADEANHKATLKPAISRWVAQYGASRPLETRLTPPRTLHDRLLVIDGTHAWILTQSLNAFASRSPASIVRADDETAGLKIATYESIWQAAKLI
jgi:hypothetical protein